MPYPMRIGRMDQPITLQSPTESKDSVGAVTVTWANASTRPNEMAEYVMPTGGTEQFSAEAVTAKVAPIFRIWYRADVQPKWRVLWTPFGGSQLTLQVQAVIPTIDVAGMRCVFLHCGYLQ